MATQAMGRSRCANSPPGSLSATYSTPKMTLSKYFSSSSAISTTNGTANTATASMLRATLRPLRSRANTWASRLITEQIGPDGRSVATAATPRTCDGAMLHWPPFTREESEPNAPHPGSRCSQHSPAG